MKKEKNLKMRFNYWKLSVIVLSILFLFSFGFNIYSHSNRVNYCDFSDLEYESYPDFMSNGEYWDIIVNGYNLQKINEANIEEVYQGPVRPTDDEYYFRKTGITRNKIQERLKEILRLEKN